MFNVDLGETIREARKKKDLTMIELSKMTDLTQGYLSKIENNKKIPKIETLKKIGNTLDIPLGELLLKAGYIEDFKVMLEENLKKPPSIPTLGEALKESREELELSIDEISIATNIDITTLNQLEHGENIELSEQQLLDLAEVCDYLFAYLYLLTGKGNNLFDRNILNNILIRLGSLPASYVKSVASMTFEEFHESEKELSNGYELQEDRTKEIYDELTFANEIDQLIRLYALPNLWNNSPDIRYILEKSNIELKYKGRTLSSKDKEKILIKIDEIKDEFEYQD